MASTAAPTEQYVSPCPSVVRGGMRPRGLLLIVATMVRASGPAVRADYSTEIKGTKDGELADSRDKVAELKQYAE